MLHLKNRDSFFHKNKQGLMELVDIMTGEVLARQQAPGGPIIEFRKKMAERCFNTIVADQIIQRVMEGEGLSNICKDGDMPSLVTVAYWRSQNASFDEALEAAFKTRAEVFRDKAVNEAEEIVDKDTAAAARVKSEIYWKSASHDHPGRFGNRTNIAVGAVAGFIVDTGIRRDDEGVQKQRDEAIAKGDEGVEVGCESPEEGVTEEAVKEGSEEIRQVTGELVK